MISLMDMKMIKSHFQDCFEFIDKCNNSQGLISPHILNFENIGDLIILSMKTKRRQLLQDYYKINKLMFRQDY